MLLFLCKWWTVEYVNSGLLQFNMRWKEKKPYTFLSRWKSASLVSQNAFLWEDLRLNMSLHHPDVVPSEFVKDKYWFIWVRCNGVMWEGEVGKCQGLCSTVTGHGCSWEKWSLLFEIKSVMHLLPNWEQKGGREKSCLSSFTVSCTANSSAFLKSI